MSQPKPTPLQALTKPIVATFATLAATGAWLVALGSAVMWVRLDSIDVPPAPTVAQLPTDLRLVIGARYLVLPLAAALLALLALFIARNWASDRRAENAWDQTPLAYGGVAGGLAAGGVVAVVLMSASPVGGLVMLAVLVLFLGATWRLMLAVTGFPEGVLVLFFSVLITGGLLALVAEATTSPRLDIAVVEREDETALGGFYLGSNEERVMLVGAAVPGGQGLNVVEDQAAGRLPVPPTPCTDLEQRAPVGDGSTDCYINETVIIPASDVRKLTIGPRGRPVDAGGYAAARQLAQLALRRGDEERLAPPGAAAGDAG